MNMYLGAIYVYAKFQPDRTNMAASRLAAILEKRTCYYS
jgi:hypothetical protein